MVRWLALFALLPMQIVPGITAPGRDTGAGALDRHYTEGSVSHYIMTGDNDGWRYTIHAQDVVKRDAAGQFYEEISWSNLTSNAQQPLTAASLALRQTVSLDAPVAYMKVPNLAGVQPLLIGPITDTLTLYSDLLLAMRAHLVRPGHTAYVPCTTPNSWADGHRVLIGRDVVDFHFTVESVGAADHTEKIVIQHVPPPQSHVHLPAKWMQTQVSTRPNNFVQVSRKNGGFVAEAGQETFDVRLVVDTRDGHMLSATLHNPVSLTTRSCTDRELNKCGPAVSNSTLRDVTWKQVP